MNEELDPTKLRELLDATARLPREVVPSNDAWPAIRARIEAQRVRSIAPTHDPVSAPAPRTRWLIAAAAVVVLASGATLVARQRPEPMAFVAAPAAPAAPQPTGGPGSSGAAVAVAANVANASNPALAAALDQYREASRELEAEVAAHAAALSPNTREVVRRSLATIDTAIADLRAALGADPRDVAAGQALSLVYERKLDFLKRVRAIPAAGM
ncbi:MAG: hypothetical protein P3A28_04195 [Gemmatimonadota bacterium]|nr:hypothetical protein [Gemmatimonadota bacterium]